MRHVGLQMRDAVGLAFATYSGCICPVARKDTLPHFLIASPLTNVHGHFENSIPFELSAQSTSSEKQASPTLKVLMPSLLHEHVIQLERCTATKCTFSRAAKLNCRRSSAPRMSSQAQPRCNAHLICHTYQTPFFEINSSIGKLWNKAEGSLPALHSFKMYFVLVVRSEEFLPSVK